jgi:D-arabinose 1-dehydrogenase-like Zn-dependent alcohol dehydrogenase
MRAAITRAPNGPITFEEVADPVAGAGEVLVAVYAASVNRLDRAVYEGKGLGRAATFPLIQGLDAAGVLHHGGDLERGTRVVVKPTAPCGRCRWCQAGRDADCTEAKLLGIHRPGGFAEYVTVPEKNVFPMPSSMSYEAAAAAAHVFPVVLRGLRAAGLTAGETVFVTAGAGAIGSAAIQLTRALGARVLATCSTETKAKAAIGLGATVLMARGEKLQRLILDHTDGTGVDVVLDGSGDPAVVSPALDALGRGGRFVVVGTLSAQPLGLDLGRLYLKRQRIIGSASSSMVDFGDAFALMAQHHIEPMIGATHPLEQIESAFESVVDRTRIGKTVVTVRGERA